MVKRIFAVFLCFAALAGLFGCASILDDEISYVTAHQESAITPSGSVVEVDTFEELKAVLLGFIMSHEDSGDFRVYSYSGDLQKDIDLACAQIMNDDPFGAYVVSEMTNEVTKIVSYYDVEVQLTYKDVTKEQLDSIITVSTTRFLKSGLQDMLSEYATSMTVLTKNIALTAEDALAYVQEIYYDNPMNVVMLPITTVDFYPDHGMNRIIEFTFGYRYEASTLKVMEGNLENAVQNIAESVSGDNDGAILLSFCKHLMDTVEYDTSTAASGEFSNQKTVATAYGALVNGSAVGEGYAMAYKALCDELGIESYVVLGEHDGKSHAWNIVYLDGYYYHVDVSMSDVNGISGAFLLDDKTMAKSYTWDTSKYKVCDGPLTYKSLIDNSAT